MCVLYSLDKPTGRVNHTRWQQQRQCCSQRVHLYREIPQIDFECCLTAVLKSFGVGFER